MKTITGTAIVDKPTLRIVAIFPEGQEDHYPEFPNLYHTYHGTITADQDLTEHNCYQFRFDLQTGNAVEVPGDSERIMEQLALASRKFQVYKALTDRVSSVRQKVSTPIYGQAEVYKMKEAQARTFRKGGYKNQNRFPMVTQYAESIGRTPKQAADMILRKANEKNSVMAMTEHARVVFKNAIFSACTFEQLQQVADSIASIKA